MVVLNSVEHRRCTHMQKSFLEASKALFSYPPAVQTHKNALRWSKQGYVNKGISLQPFLKEPCMYWSISTLYWSGWRGRWDNGRDARASHSLLWPFGWPMHMCLVAMEKKMVLFSLCTWKMCCLDCAQKIIFCIVHVHIFIPVVVSLPKNSRDNAWCFVYFSVFSISVCLVSFPTGQTNPSEHQMQSTESIISTTCCSLCPRLLFYSLFSNNS